MGLCGAPVAAVYSMIVFCTCGCGYKFFPLRRFSKNMRMYVCDLVALYTFADFSLPLVSSFSGGATPQCALERCVVFDVRIERCLLLLLLELLLFVVVVVVFCYTVFVFLLNGKLFNEVAAAGIELAKKKIK